MKDVTGSKSKKSFKLPHGKITRVPISSLVRETAYQREKLRKRTVNEIAENFKPLLFFAILVGKRSDGSLHVIDGQHRVAGAVRLGMTEIDCVIIPSTGPAFEAEVFMQVDGARNPLSTNERFKPLVITGDVDAGRVQDVADKYGILLRGTSGTKATTMAPYFHKFVGLHGDWGLQCLDCAFDVICQAYAGDRYALRQEFLKGFLEFLRVQMSQTNFKRGELVAMLRSQTDTPQRLARQLKERKESNKKPAMEALTEESVKMFSDIFNGSKKKVNRLTY